MIDPKAKQAIRRAVFSLMQYEKLSFDEACKKINNQYPNNEFSIFRKYKSEGKNFLRNNLYLRYGLISLGSLLAYWFVDNILFDMIASNELLFHLI